MWVANAASPILPETPEGAHATDAFSVDSQTTGTKGTNLFAGFTSPALTIVNGNVSRSSGTHKFAKGTTDVPAFVSTYSCMDSEITFRMGVGKVVLRYDPVAGSGLVCGVFNYGGVTIGVQPSGISLSDYNSVGSFQFSADLTAFGWTALNEDDVFTFGVVGLTFYAKWNGVTVLSKQCLQQLAPGTAMIWPHPGFDGVGDTSITYTSPTMYSNRAKRMIDLRDFGLKSVSTIGSMSSGSNQITVANASNLVIGDRIIIATGGEAGAGLRGTLGVGGSWPPLSYTDATAMNADTTKADFTPAWLRSTGFVYRYNTSTSQWDLNRDKDGPEGISLDGGDYYSQMASPLAMVTTITAKAGNVLTLDQSCLAATTNAEVYFDNYYAFSPVWDDHTSQGLSIRIPPGDYALGQSVQGTLKHGFTVGALDRANKPRIFAPKGAPNVEIQFLQSNYVTIENLRIEGNHKAVGAGSHAQYFHIVSNPANRGAYVGAANTLNIGLATQGLIRGCDVTDIMAFACRFNTMTSSRMVSNTLTMNARIESYLPWFFEVTDGSTDCTVQNCSVPYSISLCKAFETFVGARNTFINCGGMNVLCSTNNSFDWVYDGFYSTITADSYSYMNAGFWNEPIMNVNDNAYQSGNTGLIKNPRIIQTGYINSNHDTLPAIIVQTVVTDVQIIGEYDGLSAPFADGLGGFLSAPDYGVIDPNYSARASTSNIGPSVGRGVVINAPRTTVRGLRIVGAAKSGISNLEVTSTATSATVTGCVADTFSFQAGTTKSGNRTNAGVSVP